jgi:hypothetical protein
MVQDAEGRWWAKHRESGAWHYYDGSTWVRGTPPGYQEETEERPTRAESLATEREEKRRGALPWVLAAGLVGVVALIAIVVYLWAGNVGGAGTAEVPNVVGKSRSEAEETLKSAGFEVKTEARESSDEDAGKVIEQSPSGGEAEHGSTVAIAIGEGPKPAPGYNLIQDPSGGLTVEVPDGWEALTGAASEQPPGLKVKSWSAFADVDIASSITATPDLETWHDLSEPVPGTYIVASRALAQRYTDDQMIYSGPFAGMADNCTAGPSKDFDRPPLSGKMQTWYNCRGQGITNLLVSAAPEGRECVVFVQVRMISKADRAAAQHIFDTLRVDCGGIAGIEMEDRGIAGVSRVNEGISPG